MLHLPDVRPVDGTSSSRSTGLLEGTLAAAYHCPDVITMDAEMPVMNGFLTTRTLRAHGFAGPIYGCTGNSLPEDQDYFLDCGVNAVFVKPVPIDHLVQRIAQALGVPADGALGREVVE